MVNFRLCGFQLTKQNKNKKTEKKKKKTLYQKRFVLALISLI